MGAFEHGDSGRSGLFDGFDPFAKADASAQARVLGRMPGLWNAAFDEYGRGFALHGVLGGAPGVESPFVSRFSPDTMEETGRTALPTAAADAVWTYPGGVAVHADGFVYAVYSTRLVKLSAVTLEILAVAELPAPNGLAGTAYNGFVVLPGGAILTKSHHRRVDCPFQGFRALVECGVTGLPPSVVVVLRPRDLDISFQGSAPELIGGRVSCVRWRGRDFVYLAGIDAVHRMVHRNGALAIDPTWGPVPYRSGESTPGTAVVVFGDYVVIQDNALPSRSPSRLHVISQIDAQRAWVIEPFFDRAVERYYMPSKPSVDVANGRIYVGDSHAGLAAVDFHPALGLKRAWVRGIRTGSFITIMGSRARRVLAVSDIGDAPYDSHGTPRHRVETCRWLDARTGAELAAIAGLPRNFGLTLTPGPNGALYYATRTEGLYQLRPASPAAGA